MLSFTFVEYVNWDVDNNPQFSISSFLLRVQAKLIRSVSENNPKMTSEKNFRKWPQKWSWNSVDAFFQVYGPLMETLVGSGVIDPMEDLSHMEGFLEEEFSSEQGSTLLKANSVIDPSSWTLVS